MKRRDVLRSGLTLGAGAALLPTRARSEPVDLSFPKDFAWGCATAAYQIEGAVNADGGAVRLTRTNLRLAEFGL